MSRIPLQSIETAPDDAKPRLEAAEKANGFLPNVLRVLANAPATLEAFLTLGQINAKASLTLAEREVVQLTAAATPSPASTRWRPAPISRRIFSSV